MASSKEIRSELDKDEIDYPALAIAFGEAALPELKAIVVEDQPRLAPKATYLAGLIAGKTSHEIVALAARSRHDVVRVSAAAATASLPASHATEITATLLQDADPGVRGRAAKSAAKIGDPALTTHLRKMAIHDPELSIRNLATDLSEIPRGDTAEGAATGKTPGTDMTEGAATGTMPGIDMTEGAATGTMPGADMTKGAATGTMPGADMTKGAATSTMPGADMTKGAATSTMPGADMTKGAATGTMPGADMTEGAAAGTMPGADMGSIYPA